MTTLLATLQNRGCIQDTSNFSELEKLLATEKISFYCGFDPTSDSLHVGNMVPLIIMRRLQEAGHKPIAVIGAATGMIGDPSGKSEERILLDQEVIKKNILGIEKQIKIFLHDKGENAVKILRNDDWLGKINYIEFLREVGKHFSVNAMLAKDSVKSRLENREQGISYTEFSYMLLQAYDFYLLHKNHNCRLQVGGSDQWGNITAGLDLIRRKSTNDKAPAWGLTFPLLTTASGGKFGKTEQGAVWLSSARTSSYQFYQYWLNTADADATRFLRLFTPLAEEEIAELEKSTKKEPELRLAQAKLADELTTLIHGPAATKSAVQASRILFGEKFTGIDSKTLLDVFGDVPATELAKNEAALGMQLQDLLVRTGLANSKGAAKRLIEGGGVYINNERVADISLKVEAREFIDGSVLVLRSGKKNYHLVRLA